MSAPAPVPVVGVSGGVAGVEAEWAALHDLVDALDRAADRAREQAGLGPRVASDPDLLASAVFSPATCAVALAAVARATAGPDGALGRGLAWEADAVAVRVAVAGLVAADLAAREAVGLRDHALGHVVAGLGLAGLALGAPAAPLAAAGWSALPPALRARLAGAVSAEVQQVATDHPGAVETLFDSGGGLVDGVLGSTPLHRGSPQGAAVLADLYDDGSAVVTERPDVPVPAAAQRRPADLAGLVSALAGVARLSTGPSSPLNGTIAVATLRDPAGGRPRHVVYLPGTDDLTTRPWTQDGDVRDMGTNLQLMAGRPTAYGAGVLQALHRAGVGPDEPVLLVGHSQGGMQAVALAAADTPYRITDVVTAGSPTAQVDLPEGVRALSLENRGDVVPLTDGRPNPATVDHVTVTVDAGGAGVVGHHDHDRYVAAAAAVDHSDDPSARAAMQGLRREGWLGDDTASVDTRVFQVTRR